MVSWSQWNFAHATTAMLLWLVQNVIVFRSTNLSYQEITQGILRWDLCIFSATLYDNSQYLGKHTTPSTVGSVKWCTELQCLGFYFVILGGRLISHADALFVLPGYRNKKIQH